VVSSASAGRTDKGRAVQALPFGFLQEGEWRAMKSYDWV
jgi:hypothetical protein